ncbi:MAG TPA: SHOCT domain-containing protein [Acidimicrobiia bacterium]|nr:SHOCT domain-containing protein [Acidimicrobiia bacterium]
MPRLMRTMARTAVVAGTATAVSNRVSRRQADRWSDQADAQAYQEEQAAAAQAQYAAPPPPAASSGNDQLAQLKELGELKAAGVLTEEEFAAQKAKILGG